MDTVHHIEPRDRRKIIEPREFENVKRSYDAQNNINVVKLFSGDWYVTRDPSEMLVTILGSCVAACIRDPIVGVGGMNHFLLPGEGSSDDANARFGVYAMECLINEILKEGGRKDRLEVKVFGGGNVLKSSAKIGSKNAAFIRSFLHKEGLRIVSEDLEGDDPRRLRYYPTTGKVLMRRLKRQDDIAVIEEEKRYQKSLQASTVEGEIDLF